MRTVFAVVLLSAACRQPPTAPAVSARAWPEADALFRSDPRWLGADAAFSVPMGDGRILWLFGDTFVARTTRNVRSESTMVRNTIGVQRGSDPTTAAMTFHWRGTSAAPASYFPEDGDRWYWPQHGIRLGRALVVFLTRVKATPGRGLGFEADGWRAAVVDDASGDPADWLVRIVAAAQPRPGLVPGAALNVVGDYVVSLAVREPGNHEGFVARWKVIDLAAGRVDGIEWWAGDRWGGEPARVIANAGPESSLHFDPSLNQWVHVRSDGFGATTVVVSFAAAIEGPWSPPTVAFRPPESDGPRPFVYAAKGHPALGGPGLAVTYCTNTLDDFSRLVRDSSLYYPRFARVTYGRR